MKNTILYVIIFVLGIVVLFQSTTCNDHDVQLFGIVEQLNRIDSLRQHNDSLKLRDDSLTVNYSIAIVFKDSFVMRLKNKYITIYDTISQQTVDCLPKNEVDSLIMTYEAVIGSAEAVIEVKDEQIYILDKTNETKDTIIENMQVNEETLKKSLKKEKRKKFVWGGFGFGIGYLFSKVL